MQNVQRIVLVDFGAQYTQLIARRVREAKVFCEVVSYLTPLSEILEKKPVGIILSGGPASVLDADAPHIDPAIYEQGIPVLGICYGMQLTAYTLGGTVERAAQREYGRVPVDFDVNSPLFAGMKAQSVAWMSHTFHVTHAPEGFTSIAHSENCAFCAMANPEKRIYAVQFHPEVTHSEEGQKVIANFLYNVCGCTGDWTMSTFIDNAIASIREQVGPNGRVMLGLSGGVDSSVAAALISRAIGERLTCVYVDHGFMRKNETEEVRAAFAGRALDLRIIDASEQFLKALEGVTDPEEKRKRIGREFVRAFEKAARDCGNPSFLAQGTIYPDVVESGSKNKSAVIKSHHNVGGLPKDMSFEGVVEPLRGLFKDEVRALGRMLGLPKTLVERQPFPGPGLAIRVIGEVTRERLHILREADAIVREEIRRSRVKADQYFCVLTNVRSVGVMGDFRTYDYTLAIRAVRTNDFMTCEYARLPHTLLSRMSTRITNEVQGVNRVVYDITGKPPATIEWE